MAFDSKYFTGSDSNSYFTANSMYNSTQGMFIGEDEGFGNNPLSSSQKAIMHGFQTVMVSMVAPGGGKGNEGLGNLDRISDQQLDATGEMLRLNKMKFATHGPIVDLLGLGGEENKEQGISSEVRDKNIRLFERTIRNTDLISQKADLKHTPITVHPVGALGAQKDFFDSGHKTNDGKVIYGRSETMIDKNTGRLMPMKSTFKWYPVSDSYDRSYDRVKGTEENGYALYEITPEKHLDMANNTALDDIDKKIGEVDIKLQQMRDMRLQGSAGYSSLETEKRTLESDRLHLTSPKMGSVGGNNVFMSATDYANEILPEQITRLAMASYDTATQPTLAIENMPTHQFGKPDEIIEVVDKARNQFAEKLVSDKGLSSSEAKKKAEELIGFTFDMGHLNMLKSKVKNEKTGEYYTDEDLKQMTERMAKKGIKLVHIADNIGEFGQDSHMMIGRGNAKVEEMFDILKQNGFQGQAVTESYSGEGDFDKVWAKSNWGGMGVSMYQAGSGPRFSDVDMSNQYSMRSSTYGHKLPDLHFSQWGGPFAGLQSTFGGSGGGQRDKFSGAPTN